MAAHNIFFFVAIFFLFGVFAQSVGAALSFVFIAVFIFECIFLIVFLATKKNIWIWFALLIICIPLGASYAVWRNERFEESTRIVFEKTISITGFVANNPVAKENISEFAFRLDDYYKGIILVKVPLYPQFHYGDILEITGIIERPFGERYTRYLAKEGMSGVMAFPRAEKIGNDGGSPVRKFLFTFKENITDATKKILPPLEAAFLNGIMLGGQNEFSKEFRGAMQASGTTHLVALSGYNITIVAWVIMGIFAFMMNRRGAFIATIPIIGLFVLMTGAEASVVRAAIMGVLILFAENMGRASSIRNIIALTALIMVFENPNVLVFDLGFQLSFFALFGILFLRPALENLMHIKDAGFLSWKDNLIGTFSAQVSVAPILMNTFGSISLTSLIANVLVLEVVPIAMGLGFIAAAFSFISYYAALIIGLVVMPLLKFSIFIIERFAMWSIPINFHVTVYGVALYYACIVWFIKWQRK